MVQLAAMDLYGVLGLTHEADTATIRAAYRRLAKLYHPDVSKLPDAQARFIAITEAYEVLCDPVARDRYDRTHLSPSPRTASPNAEARYARYTRQRQQAARTKAEQYGRMGYEDFDKYAFDTVASYVGPKLLGCFGIAGVCLILLILLTLFVEFFDLSPGVLFLGLMSLIVAGAYASVEFDDWHNRRQMRRKRGQGQ